ncbi:ATP-binding protein [Dolichospermum circinale]|uniref:ATP-binding protein n=1 Tax=Dolichospermum circinale TaxID=109265 RepID=UPI0003FD4B06|nr:ATP-binding protein [Dolichospermum circinale]MDB9473357.1 ATP-binding protein [Dolichospermum circinale CS-537/11]MDB9480836.1 ATP-binding protein [Dolichospermum circinale CS-537/03]MDB9483058.1 ATP-binding protein [Dolichospermum circinale CS-537/05]
MTVDEVVKFVDQMVFEKTGKHLDDIQTAVVEGTWKRETYDHIAREYNLSSSHVGDVGSELWQLLSEILHEDIKKTNFRSTFERLNIESSQNPNICIGNNYYYSSQTLNQPNKEEEKININTESKLSAYDLIFAPEIINFYQRETEIEKLSDWIFKQNTRLISVSGLYGTGKTTLVKRFIDLNLHKFAVVIWRSLKYPQPLDLFVTDLLNVCQQEPQATLDKRLKQLLDFFANQKCLIILDDLQNIFIPGKFAGQYKVEYQDYQDFFNMLTEVKHQSHVIVISQEQCSEIECLDNELCLIKSLEVSGLYDVHILQNRGLKNEDNWLKLIDLYAGNFIDLKSVSILINKNYDGQVADFLSENTLHITNQMQSRFQQIFKHLSSQEQEIVLHLSKFEIPITREYLREGLNLSVVDFNNGLQSLQERYLVTKIKNDKILFQLSSVFREYVRNYCQN